MQKGSAVAFERTLRSVEFDPHAHWVVALLTLAILLSGWFAWLVWGQVAVYEVASSLILETQSAAHPIATEVDGRVLQTLLELGRPVQAGELLLELDAQSQRLALAETQARLAGLQAQIQALQPEIQSEEMGRKVHEKSTELSKQEARERLQEARAKDQFAQRQADSRKKLAGKHLIAEEDFAQAQSLAEAQRATVRALELRISGLQESEAVQDLDRRAHIAKLQRTRANLQAQVLSEQATEQRLEHEIALRRIVAPISGELGRIEVLRVGSVVRKSDVLGAVVPRGEPHAVAYFPVARAGKIRSGQRAQLRLDAYPWTQYGSLQAWVSAVGHDPLDQRVRVELDVQASSTPFIPLIHGLTGSAEIEVERAAPAQLLLRSLGRLLTTQAHISGSEPHE